MRFSPLVSRIGGKGAQAWRVHYEAEAAKKQGRDAVLLSVGDPDLQTPAAVMDRAIEALKNGDTHYTEVAGIDKLRTAIAEQSTFDGVADSADNVVVFSGAQNALFAASLCLFSVGDEVIVPNRCMSLMKRLFGLPAPRWLPCLVRLKAGFVLILKR